MGVVGKKLKRQSLEAQGKWSDTMSQLEETLGGLRIIKAFIAEKRMVDRFAKCSNELRDANNRVAMRQAGTSDERIFRYHIDCYCTMVRWFVDLREELYD